MRRKILAIDCETDKALYGRIPKPFIWGCYDGKKFQYWRNTEKFVDWLKDQNAIAYAHNGGKFDFLFLLPFIKSTRAKIIGGRFSEMRLGKCLLRDSFKIVPVPLSAIQKDDINYDLMEKEVREEYMDSHIIPYLKTDCTVLHKVVTEFREKAGKKSTIASTALQSCRSLGINPGKTSYRFDRKFRPYYFGGRTECFQPGTHKNITIVDIVSSYPNAMLRLHPTGTAYSLHSDLNHCQTDEEIGRSFIRLKCHSLGAFPLKNDEGGLDFPICKAEFHVTGWEYLVAKKHSLISDEEIISVRTFKNTIDFTPYINKWFEHKQNHPKDIDIIGYTVGKIMQNAAYGKLAQDPSNYHDYIIQAPGTPVDKENGWKFYVSFQSHDIHRREALYKDKQKAKEAGKDWQHLPKFYNVATGASITGFARAHLLDAIHTVGRGHVIYCDTDSLALKIHPTTLPLGPDIGQWEIEGKGPIGHFAGKKLYGIQLDEKCPKSGKPKYKIASKGSKLNFEHIAKIISGKTVTWKSEFPTFQLHGGRILLKETLTLPPFMTKEISHGK